MDIKHMSIADMLRARPEAERKKIVAELPDKEVEALLWDWEFWARPSQKAPAGDWRVWMLMGGRGSGKALALDTPVPTATGWTTMGEVCVGDILFDEQGKPTRVTYVAPVQVGRPCSYVVFGDGTVVTADMDHLWTVKISTKRGIVRGTFTTEVIQRYVGHKQGATIESWQGEHRITAVLPCPSVPVICIQVDSPSRLFCVSKSMIPTHNTRAGAEWLRKMFKVYPRFHLVGRTAGDVRDILIDGDSGILRISPPAERPHYQPSKRRLTWPNGSVATLFSSDEPEALRGPQCHAFWADELAAWKYPQETWDHLMFGFRLERNGISPRGVVTTTPKPIKLVKRLLADPTVVVTRGTTYENMANLAAAYIDQIVKPYEGTRLGRQELLGEVVEDLEGALWSLAMIEANRVTEVPPLKRVVIAIDPEATNTEESSATGIVVAGEGIDGHGYVLADLSLKGSPDTWARRAIIAFHQFKADRIVAEVNQGGDMVEHTLKTVDPNIPFEKISATRGKVPRAEPIVALYEQGKVHHIGPLAKLEEQQCTWIPGMKSPDRLDACVYALTELMIDKVDIKPIRWNPNFGRRRNPWAI